MSKEPIEYLKHIRDESQYILSVITPDKTKTDFLADETLKRAVIRSLEIIGEATKKIPADFKLICRRNTSFLDYWAISNATFPLYNFTPL